MAETWHPCALMARCSLTGEVMVTLDEVREAVKLGVLDQWLQTGATADEQKMAGLGESGRD